MIDSGVSPSLTVASAGRRHVLPHGHRERQTWTPRTAALGADGKTTRLRVAATHRSTREARETAPFSFSRGRHRAADNEERTLSVSPPDSHRGPRCCSRSPRSFASAWRRQAGVEPSHRADRSMRTLTPPTASLALVGALVRHGLAAVVFLIGRGAAARRRDARRPGYAGRRRGRPQPVVASPKPPPSEAASRRERLPGPRSITRFGASRVVVVVVSIPGAAWTRSCAREARARRTLDAPASSRSTSSTSGDVGPLVAKPGVLPDPQSCRQAPRRGRRRRLGVTDRDTIAQAVAEARAMSEPALQPRIGPRALRPPRAHGRTLRRRAARGRRRPPLRRRDRGLAHRPATSPCQPGPYTFPTPVEATRFVTHAVEALIVLGCDVAAS